MLGTQEASEKACMAMMDPKGFGTMERQDEAKRRVQSVQGGDAVISLRANLEEVARSPIGEAA